MFIPEAIWLCYAVLCIPDELTPVCYCPVKYYHYLSAGVQAQTGADIILAGVQADMTSLEYDTEAGRGENATIGRGLCTLSTSKEYESVTDTIGERERRREREL